MNMEVTLSAVPASSQYRALRILEITPRPAWNAALYALAVHCIPVVLDRQMFDPICASEVIFVAKKGAP